MQLRFSLFSSNDSSQYALYSSLLEIVLKMFHLTYLYTLYIALLSTKQSK